MSRLARFAWAVLLGNVVVILWGAFVRATGSGAGCGGHWPTCNGEILPRPRSIETVVEFTHRTTSGLSGLLVLVQLVWAFVAFPKGHPARAGAVASMILMLNEGAVGAALVLLEHVAYDRSVARAAWTSLHLTNTFLLVAAMTCTAYWGSGGRAPRRAGQEVVGALLAVGTLGLLITAVSGAVTALGDTLFPPTSLAAGFAQDFTPGMHLFVRLRGIHPILAASTGAAIAMKCCRLEQYRQS